MRSNYWKGKRLQKPDIHWGEYEHRKTGLRGFIVSADGSSDKEDMWFSVQTGTRFRRVMLSSLVKNWKKVVSDDKKS